MRISRPTGFSSPNRFSATVWPSTATLRPPAASSAVKKRPWLTVQSWATNHSGSVAFTLEDQFWLPATICCVCRMVPAATCTAAISRGMAWASSQLMLGRCPAPSETPPIRMLEPHTSSRLAPSDWIWLSTCCRAPAPTATVTITAATPMKMPSAVSAARSLFAASAESAAEPASA